MIELLEIPELEAVARRVVWFEPPADALSNPARFVAYAAAYGSHEDMKVVRRHVSDDRLRELLNQAPPGIIDGRSWAYWHLVLGEYPPPALPARDIGSGHFGVTSFADIGI